MPQFNLTSLNGQELRQLLDASRSRGDAAQSYQILQEMASRREREGSRGLRLFRAKPRPGEPRIIDLNLGDPLERVEDPDEGVRVIRPEPEPEPAAPVTAAADPEPALTLERREPVGRRRAKPTPKPARQPGARPAAAARRAAAREPPAAAAMSFEPEAPHASEPNPEPRSVWDVDPIPQLRAPPERSRAPRRLGLGLAAGFVLGAAAGATAGVVVGLGTIEADTRIPTPVAPAPAATPMLTAAVAPAPVPAPVAEPEPVVEAAAETAPVEEPVEVAALPAEAEAAAAPAVEGPALELPPAPSKKPEVLKAENVKPVETDACAGERTPADRQICGDTHLQQLQKDLRRAYAEALEAHQDRTTLRQRQLAWRDARDQVSDPARLARLYEQRIKKLNAATAEARQLR